jgi:hypothetical protein
MNYDVEWKKLVKETKAITEYEYHRALLYIKFTMDSLQHFQDF